MKTLYKGRELIIDEEDLHFLREHNWGYNPEGYLNVRLNGKTVRLHRIIVNALPNEDVDHIDGNKNNISKTNLRRCSTSINCQNKTKYLGTSSEFHGVTKLTHKHCIRWRAKIKVRGQEIRLGNFEIELDAAKAYDEAAIKYFGENARTNSCVR
jgi:hypothetical protein